MSIKGSVIGCFISVFVLVNTTFVFNAFSSDELQIVSEFQSIVTGKYPYTKIDGLDLDTDFNEFCDFFGETECNRTAQNHIFGRRMKKEYDRFNDLQVYYEPKEMGNRPFTIKIGKFYNRKYDLDILQKAVIQQYGTPDMICIPTDRKRWNIQTDKYSFVRYLIYGTSKFQCTWANQHRFYPRGRSLTISILGAKKEEIGFSG